MTQIEMDRFVLNSEIERAKQYTPEMINRLRHAWIDERVMHSVGNDWMKIPQARIHAEMHLCQWELHQLSAALRDAETVDPVALAKVPENQ